jgi:predicted ester cyclase
MTARGLETIRAYWEASERGDWPAAGRCVGPGYVWIDHGTGVVARSPEELLDAQEDASCLSDVRIDIQNVFETEGGAIIVQALHSATVLGSWRSIQAAGQHISYLGCTIFKFNADDLIVFEEGYYDMLSVMRQLGHCQPEEAE